jgi:hypothetical protein
MSVSVSKFTSFVVTKLTRRRLGLEKEALVRQLATANLNVAYTLNLQGVTNVAKIKEITPTTLQSKVKDAMTAVGYTGTIEAKTFTATHPAMPIVLVTSSCDRVVALWCLPLLMLRIVQ